MLFKIKDFWGLLEKLIYSPLVAANSLFTLLAVIFQRRSKRDSRRGIYLKESRARYFFFRNSFTRRIKCTCLRSSPRPRDLCKHLRVPELASRPKARREIAEGRRTKHRQKWREALETFKAIPGVCLEADGLTWTAPDMREIDPWF